MHFIICMAEMLLVLVAIAVSSVAIAGICFLRAMMRPGGIDGR